MNDTSDLVLVTGAAGWLGTGLVNALVNGIPECESLQTPKRKLRIRALVLPGQDTTVLKSIDPTIELIDGDVRSPADCEKFVSGAAGATLIHTAGIIHPKRVREFFDINTQGTKNLLDAAAAAKMKRAVVVSSNSPCGVNPHPDHLFDESSPFAPYMSYGESKRRMELIIADIQKAGRLETVVIRAPWFYGPFQPARQTVFFEMIANGKAPIVGGGNAKRSMAYIDNLAQGLILAATTESANGKTFWIADERPYTMNEIVDTIERLLETEFNVPVKHKRMRLPGIASSVAWVVDKTLQGVGLYHQKFHVLSEMNKTIACSVEGAKRELGYRPTISLEEGMRRSLKFAFDHGQMKRV